MQCILPIAFVALALGVCCGNKPSKRASRSTSNEVEEKLEVIKHLDEPKAQVAQKPPASVVPEAKSIFLNNNKDHLRIKTAIHMVIRFGMDGWAGQKKTRGVRVIPAGRRKLTKKDLEKVEELDLSGKGLTDLAPLVGLTRLKSLYLNNNPIAELAPLSKLQSLWTLSLNGGQLNDLTSLEGLEGLVYLKLNDNKISDLTPIEGLKELKIVGLSGNQIIDLRPLAGLGKLYHLELEGNRITDLAPLAGLKSLKFLSVGKNPDLSKAKIDKLQELLPDCEIQHSTTR